MSDKNETYYSVKECAKVIGKSVPTVHNWIKEGKVDYSMVASTRGATGYKFMIPESWINEYQKEQRIKQSETPKNVVVKQVQPKVVNDTIPAVLRTLNAIADKVEGNITCDEACRYVNAMSHLVEAMNNGRN